MSDIQDVSVNSLELGAEFIRLGGLEVWWKRSSTGDGGREKGQYRRELLGRDIHRSDKAAKGL